MRATLLISVLLSLITMTAKAESIDALGIEGSKLVPVFIGGWGSCDSKRPHVEKEEFGQNTPHKMFLYNQAVRYVQTINLHAESGIEKFVLVCANKFSQSGFLAQGSIRLLTYKVENQRIIMTQKESEVVNIDSFQDNTVKTLLSVLPLRDKRPHLTTRLLEIAAGRPLVLFGHSYGGWIGKRIIEILAAPELYHNFISRRDRKLAVDTERLLESFNQFPVHTFFSLEGISAVKCRIQKSLWVGLISKFTEPNSKGCRTETRSFHREIDLGDKKNFSLELADSAARVKNWYNIMLKDSDLPTRAALSSTPGIENVILDIMPYGGPEDYEKSQGHPFKNAHHMLGFETKTWNKICALTLGDETLCNPVQNIDNRGRVK